MPFGLSNATAVFQALINDVLCNMLNCFVLVYHDDFLIFLRSPQEHVQHVCTMLKRLMENSPYIKAEECEFHVALVRFIIEKGQIRSYP